MCQWRMLYANVTYDACWESHNISVAGPLPDKGLWETKGPADQKVGGFFCDNK